MVQIEFNYNQQISVIQAKLEDKFQDVIDKYFQKTSLNPTNSIYFLANGKQINPQETVENQMNELNKVNNNIQVLVQLLGEKTIVKQVFIKSKDIICPTCHEPCRIKLDNYQLELFDCINKHTTQDIKIKDFPETQKINVSDIICEICKIKNKGNTSNNIFYKCLTCKKKYMSIM